MSPGASSAVPSDSSKAAKPGPVPPPVPTEWKAATLALADLPQEAGHPLFGPTLRDRIDKLIVLEMRANFAWRPVIALYRDALSVLLQSDVAVVATYPARLASASAAEAKLGGLAARVTDYLNWFEVNRRSGGDAGRGEFAGYFDLMGRLEALQALEASP